MAHAAAAEPLAAPQGQLAVWSCSLEDCERKAAWARQHANQPGRKAAHAFLKHWRATNRGGEYTDLTEGDAFDWMSYLGGHRDRALIFAGGLRVETFGIRSMEWLFDTNTREPRVDFVVGRTDGTTARLHPGMKEEAKVVIHAEAPETPQQLQVHWHDDVAPTLAVPQGKGKNKGKDKGGDSGDEAWEARKHFKGASAADLIPTKVVAAWVALRARGAAPGQFTMDVMSPVADPFFPRHQTFTWFLWFNKVPELAGFVDSVARIYMAKVHREGGYYEAGFWFETRHHNKYFVTFREKGVVVEHEPWWVDWNQ